MKKQTLTFALLLVISIGFSQTWGTNSQIELTGITKTETRNTSDYDQITIGGGFLVTFVTGKEGEIKITADEAILEKLITKCNNNKLEIKMENGSNYSAKILITIPIEEISKLYFSGSGSVKSDSNITAKSFDLDFSGSGNVNLPLTTKKLKVNKTGSGDLVLSGTTTNLEIDCTGSGSANTKELKAQNTEVNQSGSGDVSVFASDRLDAKLVGSGTIKYYGKPSKTNKTSVGSGSITGK
jgi:preprotein translocase subunit SecF